MNYNRKLLLGALLTMALSSTAGAHCSFEEAKTKIETLISQMNEVSGHTNLKVAESLDQSSQVTTVLMSFETVPNGQSLTQFNLGVAHLDSSCQITDSLIQNTN